jgi:hypothetical protein
MVLAQIDGETVMMCIDNCEYYGLDATAIRICQHDVLAFLNDMTEHQLIELIG